MKDDPLRRQLLAELRALRKGEGAFSADRLGECEALVRVVGMGSVEQLQGTLLEMFKRYGIEPEGDVRAYLETSGIGIDGNSLNQRLSAYADTHHLDARTGMRRSDRARQNSRRCFETRSCSSGPGGI